LQWWAVKLNCTQNLVCLVWDMNWHIISVLMCHMTRILVYFGIWISRFSFVYDSSHQMYLTAKKKWEQWSNLIPFWYLCLSTLYVHNQFKLFLHTN
jgi:hypothetical protein